MSKYTIVNLETDRVLSWACSHAAATRSARQFSTVSHLAIRCGNQMVEEYRFGVPVVKSKPEGTSAAVPRLPQPTATAPSKPKIIIRRRCNEDEDDDTAKNRTA